jgi:hypothetical protein
MTVEIAFVPGSFQSFRAKTKIHLGKLQLNLNEGEIVEFDGHVLRVNGESHPYQEFRAGVKAGWVVPIEDNISNYRPKAAGVAVRGAQDASRKVSTDVSEDDTFVAPARRPKVVREEDREPEEKEVKRFAVKREDDVTLNVAPARPSAKRTVETSGMDGLNEDSRPVGRISTPASQKTVVADASKAASEASRLDNAPPPRAVLATKTDVHAAASDKVENIIEAADPATRARMLAEARKAAVAKSEAAEASATAKETPVAKSAPAPKAEKKAAAPKAAEDPALKPVAKVQAPPQTVEEFIVRDGLVEIHPGVMWDKALHWRTRAKIALDQYASNPEALAAIRAYETPAVVQLIDTNAGRKG